MFLVSKEFPRILLISCVQQADGSESGSGPELVDVFVVHSRYFEQSAEFGRVSRADVSCADYTCDASTHVQVKRGKRRRRPLSLSCTDRPELLPEAALELQSHPPLLLPLTLSASGRHRWMFIFKTKNKSTRWVRRSARNADTTPGRALPS